MSFIGFKVEANIPKNLDGLVTEGNLVHLTKAVLVNGNEAQICIDQPTGESTVVAILDKKMNRMVNLDLIFDQSGNSLLIKGDKTAEVHVSGYSEPSGDMPFEEFESDSCCPEDFEMEENFEYSDLVATEAKEVSGVESESASSSDDEAPAAADNSSSSEESSDDEQQQKTKQVVPVAQYADSSESSSDDEGNANEEEDSSSGSDSEDVTEDQIMAMLKSLDVDAGVSDDSDSSSSGEGDQEVEEGAVTKQDSGSSGTEESGSDRDSGDDQGDSSESDSDGLNDEQAEAPVSKKRQREASNSSDSESGSESGSGSYDDSSSTEEPPAKKAKKDLNPEEKFEQDLVKYLQANGRTPLTILGSSVKKDGSVKAKLGVFIKSRPNVFLVKGNQVELK